MRAERPRRAPACIRARPKRLPDRLGARPRILFVGINPSLYSAQVGHHFASPGNPFWRLLHAARLIPAPLGSEDDVRLPSLGLGLTNIVPRPTRAASELTRAEYVAGRARLARLIARARPRTVAFVGVTVYRAFFGAAATPGPGAKRQLIGTARVFVLPNPSGLNAAYPGFRDKLISVRPPRAVYGIDSRHATGREDRDRDRGGLGHGPGRCRALRPGGRPGGGGGRGRRRRRAGGGRDRGGGRHRARHRGRPHEGRGVPPHRVGHREPLQGARLRVEPRRPSRPRRGRGHRHERLRPRGRPQSPDGPGHDRGRDPGDAPARRRQPPLHRLDLRTPGLRPTARSTRCASSGWSAS